MSKHLDKLVTDEWGADQPDVHPVWEAQTRITIERQQALLSPKSTDLPNEADSIEFEPRKFAPTLSLINERIS